MNKNKFIQKPRTLIRFITLLTTILFWSISRMNTYIYVSAMYHHQKFVSASAIRCAVPVSSDTRTRSFVL